MTGGNAMVEALRARWWVFTLRGVVAVVFGVLALLWPAITLLVLAILVAAYLIVDGVAALYHAFTRSPEPQPRWLLTFQGALSLLLGVVIAIWPVTGVGALVILFGFWAVASGLALIVAGWRPRSPAGREWLTVLTGLLSIAVGVLVFVLPFAAATALALLVGAYAVALGIAQIALGLRVRRRGRHRADSPAPTSQRE